MFIGIALPFAPCVNTHNRIFGLRYHDHKSPAGIKHHLLRNRKGLSRAARFISLRIIQRPVIKDR